MDTDVQRTASVLSTPNHCNVYHLIERGPWLNLKSDTYMLSLLEAYLIGRPGPVQLRKLLARERVLESQSRAQIQISPCRLYFEGMICLSVNANLCVDLACTNLADVEDRGDVTQAHPPDDDGDRVLCTYSGCFPSGLSASRPLQGCSHHICNRGLAI